MAMLQRPLNRHQRRTSLLKAAVDAAHEGSGIMQLDRYAVSG
jgi:hypothetical protein